jgi:hypothetical protein
MGVHRRGSRCPAGSHKWCMPPQLGAYCGDCTQLVRMHEHASQLCVVTWPLIVKGESGTLQRLIVYLLMVKSWHSFCFN